VAVHQEKIGALLLKDKKSSRSGQNSGLWGGEIPSTRVFESSGGWGSGFVYLTSGRAESTRDVEAGME